MNGIILILFLLTLLFPMVGLFGIFFAEGKKGTLFAAALLTIGTTTIPLGMILLHNASENFLRTGIAEEIKPAYALYGIPLGMLISYIAISIKASRSRKKGIEPNGAGQPDNPRVKL